MPWMPSSMVWPPPARLTTGCQTAAPVTDNLFCPLHPPPPFRNADALEYMGVALSLLPCCPSGCGPDAKQTAMMQQAKAARESAVSS